MNGWTYLKVYLGDAWEKCDNVLIELSDVVSSLAPLKCWFFLRYIDDAGFHVRLRLLPNEAGRANFDSTARRSIQRVVQRLPFLSPSSYCPMVPEADVEIPHTRTSIVSAAYVPEYDKFSGPDVMPVVENLFMTSSRIAIEVLEHEARGLLSRKTLAPCFMQATLDTFSRDAALQTFWSDYSYHWLGGRGPAADDFRSRSFAKGQHLAQEGIPVVTSREQLERPAAALLDAWQQALDVASTELTGRSESLPDQFAFHIMHLMNNRCGISVIEEAHLAALIEHASEAGQC